jgi:hypothetical protein
MLRLGIAITTAPRPEGQDYFSLAHASLRSAGFDEHLHVFAEPGSPTVADEEMTRHAHKQKLGCFGNFRQAVRHMSKQEEYDWVLMLQDDVVFRDDAAARLRAEVVSREVAKTGFLSLYTNKAMRPATADGREEGWHRPNFYMGEVAKGKRPAKRGKGYWGALAGCWPRETLVRMQQHPRFRDHTHHRKVDVVIGHSCIEMGLDVATYVPSLADHVGARSTIGRDKVGNQWGRYGKDFREKSDGAAS